MNTYLESNNSVLELRAKMIEAMRVFFKRKKILEVETPILSHSTNPAAYLSSFKCNNLYLQTSPEFAMKRLLAAGSGDIYQICKAFRKGEHGKLHNQEFTMLEWYRLGFDHHDLMKEVAELLITTLNTKNIQKTTYQDIFIKFLNLDPHRSNIEELYKIANYNNLNIINAPNNYDVWLQLLFTHLIEPKLGFDMPVFVYDFPKSQAMLARLCEQNKDLAARFEVYYRGIELANGFYELNDSKEQRARFIADLKQRKKLKLPLVPIDENFLSIVDKLPDCSGVAIGVDRLIMLSVCANNIDQILCYPFDKT